MSLALLQDPQEGTFAILEPNQREAAITLKALHDGQDDAVLPKVIPAYLPSYGTLVRFAKSFSQCAHGYQAIGVAPIHLIARHILKLFSCELPPESKEISKKSCGILACPQHGGRLVLWCE